MLHFLSSRHVANFSQAMQCYKYLLRDTYKHITISNLYDQYILRIRSREKAPYLRITFILLYTLPFQKFIILSSHFSLTKIGKKKKSQQTKEFHPSTPAAVHSPEAQQLKDKKVKDLKENSKRRLVEVPYTASLAHPMNALVANRVVAVPVAAQPGHWVGAGGSMIMEADKQTGIVRKHYIEMVTMFDILAHIADADDDEMDGGDGSDLDRKMSIEVSANIGHCLEGLSLWTLNPNTRFLKEHNSELQSITSNSIKDLGAIIDSVFAISHRAKVIDAIKSVRLALLNAVPIVEALAIREEDHKQLINGRARKVIGTFSSTDLRGCHLSTLKSWLPLSALEFIETVSRSPLFAEQSGGNPKRGVVSREAESSLAQVIDKALTHHVHRIWVVDSQGLLVGLVSLTDIIRVLRLSLMS